MRFLIAVVAFVSVAAQAQIQLPPRTFVASTGNDANPCSRTSPCRSFGIAVAAVQTGGEVVALDSAGYGPVTISKGVAIISPAGVYAGITATTGDAITITAGSSAVLLRGLSMNGMGATNGINATAVGILHVESCAMRHFNEGLRFTSDGGLLYVDDSSSSDNTDIGFFANSSSGVIIGTFDHCVAQSNANQGFFIEGTGSAITVSNSVAAGSSVAGVEALLAQAYVKNCVLANNYAGVFAYEGTVSVAGSTISGGEYAFMNNTGTVLTFGNNDAIGNVALDSGGTTPASLH